MARKNKIYCRFKGCTHKGFTSRAGRLYHERTKHGRAFTDVESGESSASVPDTKTKDPNTEPEIKDQPRQDTFVKIEDVKFKMAKTKREPKKDDDGEYEYECGKCGHEFNGVTKFCPDCGCELVQV